MRSTVLRWAGLAAAFLAGQTTLAAEPPGPFAGPSEVIDFAISDVCLPYLRLGGALTDYTGRYGREWKYNGTPGIRLGHSQVLVGTGRQGSGRCYVVGMLGFAPGQRQAVFASFAKHGVHLDPIAGPKEFLLKKGSWSVMDEDYCFRIDGRVMRARLRTSTHGPLSQGFRFTPLELSLAWDKGDEAVENGHCAE